MSKNISKLSGRKGLDNNLFERLGQAAAAEGTPSVEALNAIRNEFLVGKSTVYGAASFYDFLREENRGKKAYVCNGSACRTAGTQNAVHAKLKNHFTENEIGEMCCLGRCHENAAFHVDGHNYSGADIDSFVKKNTAPTKESYNVGHLGTRILTAPYGEVKA